MTQPHSTKALDWRNAKLKGQRLPEHELSDLVCCDLCQEAKPAEDFSPAAYDVSGQWACTLCVETQAEGSIQ